MIYVMSDIHGCYEKYEAMLKKINFTKEDTLYIVGDVLDRGNKGMKTLLDIAGKKNIILLCGNHDRQAAAILLNLDLLLDEKNKEFASIVSDWLSDGGNATMNEYLTLSDEDKARALKAIVNAPFSKEIELNHTTYLLAHTVPEVDLIYDYENWGEEEFLLGEPDYEEVYFDDKIIITGHTPTGYIEAKSNGKIWIKNNHIAIDCGAVFGNPLGCLCLDTMEEFYVK